MWSLLNGTSLSRLRQFLLKNQLSVNYMTQILKLRSAM